MSALAFIVVIFFTSMLQRISGFSFALLAVAGSSAIAIASLWEITFAVTLLLLANTAISLIEGRSWPEWKTFFAILAGILPGTIIGLLVLWLLSTESSGTEHWLLGLFTLLVAGLMWRNQGKAHLSSRWKMALMGSFSGLTGGAFGAPGPPLVYGLYQQPMRLTEIRTLLFSVFFLYGALRTILAIGSEAPSHQSLWLALIGLPGVIAGTFLGQYLAKRMDEAHVRRLAISLLAMSGVLLIVRQAL